MLSAVLAADHHIVLCKQHLVRLTHSPTAACDLARAGTTLQIPAAAHCIRTNERAACGRGGPHRAERTSWSDRERHYCESTCIHLAGARGDTYSSRTLLETRLPSRFRLLVRLSTVSAAGKLTAQPADVCNILKHTSPRRAERA